jgi:hypothetical protein
MGFSVVAALQVLTHITLSVAQIGNQCSVSLSLYGVFSDIAWAWWCITALQSISNKFEVRNARYNRYVMLFFSQVEPYYYGPHLTQCFLKLSAGNVAVTTVFGRI